MRSVGSVRPLEQLGPGILLADRPDRGRRGEQRAARRAARSRARTRPHPASRPACPRTAPSSCRRAAARRRCRSGRRPSRRRRRPRRPRPGARRRRSPCSRRAPRRARRCRARRPSAGRSCPTCRGRRAGRSRAPGRTAPARLRPRGPSQSRSRPGVSSAASCGRCRITQCSGGCVGLGQRGVEQRLVGERARALEPARGREHELRLRVVDAHGELVARRSRRTPPSGSPRAARTRASP